VAQMMKRPRRLARRAQSQAWVSNGCFGFLCGINSGHEVQDPLPYYFNLQRVGAEMPFLASNLEAHLAPLLMMASGGHYDKRSWGEGPSHDGRQPPPHWARMDTALSWASSSTRWGFTPPP
jgi:hypothetical protein